MSRDRSKGKKDFASGIFFFILGSFLFFQSMHYPIWGRNVPLAGFFPLIISLIMIGFSLVVLIKSLVLIRQETAEKLSNEQGESSPNTFRIISYIVMILFYGVLIEKIGFMISTVLFLLLMFKVVEKQAWKITILAGLVSIIASYLLFVYLLEVPLPKGLLKWL